MTPLPAARLVETVLKSFQRGARTGFNPPLVNDTTESVPAGVLVASVARGFRALFDVGEDHDGWGEVTWTVRSIPTRV